MDTHEFVYRTYVRTTPEELWRALTEPRFTRHYWNGVALESDWTPGSPVRWQEPPGEEFLDLGQRVLESEPYRRLSYSWHHFQPHHAELLGWTDDEFAEAVAEPRTRVTFDLDPAGEAVRLTLTHDGFAPGSVMRDLCSGAGPHGGGWPEILASLKSLLETGRTLSTAAEAA